MGNIKKLFLYILSILLIFGLLLLIYYIVGKINNDNSKNDIEIINELKLNKLDNYYLAINSNNTSVNIVKDDYLFIESDNRNISIDYDKSTYSIVIDEKKLSRFDYTNSYNMTIHMPSAFFKEVDITTESGNIIIDEMNTNRLNLNVGAGQTNINNLTVYKEANVVSGVGRVFINGSVINNLTLSSGVGESSISTILAGNSYISSGVGNVYITILQGSNHYTFNNKKGIGDIRIDNNKVNDTVYGSGPSMVNITSGIGNVNIIFKEENK